MTLEKRILLFLLTLVLMIPAVVRGQFGSFTIEPCTTEEEVISLIDTVFLAGVNQSQYRNITFTGNPQSVGYFYDGFMFSEFEIKKGIVMSSGLVANIDQSNNCSSVISSTTLTSGGHDADLTQMSGYSINDACIIEFDFKPTNQVSAFRYVFASEEYPEFVNDFNDAFGFFLSGDTIDGPYSLDAINIATIPGTNLGVTISNLNCGDVAGSCTPGPNPNAPYCYLLNENNVSTSPSFRQLAFNAYTDGLVAQSGTTPCEWYHIKLVIGDAVDHLYDSGVFLEMGSFDPGKVVETTSYSHPTVDSLLYESCNNHEAVLYFDIGSSRSEDFSIPFHVEGTAQLGIDYTLLSSMPNTIFIPAGSTYDSIVIRPFMDYEVEGIEDVQVKYIPVICGMGFEETATVYISDLPDFRDTNLIFQSICEDTIAIGFENVLNGVPPYRFQWKPSNETTSWLDYIISGTDSARVPCIITDTCGFQRVDTAIVLVPDLIATAGPDKSLCNLPEVQLEGACAGAQHFEWTANPADASLVTPNIPDPMVSPVVNTTYTLTAWDNCTQSDQDQAQVLLDEATADAGEDLSICELQVATLTCNAGATYTWTASPPDPSLTGQEGNQTINVSPAVNTTYSVNVVNDCGFDADDDVVVTVFSLPAASAGNDDEICFNASYQLNASGGTHYQWSSIPADPSLTVNGQDTLANPLVTPDTQTSYTYTVTVINDNGCQADASMQLDVNPIPNVSIATTDTLICYGAQANLSALGNALFTWSTDIPDPSLTGQEGNTDIIVSPEVTTTYTLTGVVSGFNCPAIIEQTVVVVQLPSSDFTTAQQTCQNSPTLVTYTGTGTDDFTYTWDFGQGQITNGTGAGPYIIEWPDAGSQAITLTVTDQACDGPTSSVVMDVLKMPVPSFDADPVSGCAPLVVEFTNTSQNLGDQSTDYLWSFTAAETSTLTDPTFEFTEPGTYSIDLQVTNDDLCVDQLQQNNMITVYELPTADFTPDPVETILEQGTITFTNGSTDAGAMTFVWDFNDGSPFATEESPTHQYTDTGTYYVLLTATNANGCIDSLSKMVIVHPDFAVYAPTAFSPNADGINDTFELLGTGISSIHVQIFNRWGQLVYETSSLGESWDGTVNGKPAEAGTYVYKIQYTSMINISYNTQGSVMLIR